jgi:hypothetical protein
MISPPQRLQFIITFDCYSCGFGRRQARAPTIEAPSYFFSKQRGTRPLLSGHEIFRRVASVPAQRRRSDYEWARRRFLRPSSRS